MSSQHSTQKTIVVAALLCIVCSSVVSSIAVSLKDEQKRNETLDKRRNILECAGLIDKRATNPEVEAAFAKVESKIIDLATGKEVDNIDSDEYDQRKAAKDPEMSVVIPKEYDPNRVVKRRAKYARIYLVEEDGELAQIILPVHGYGLWSTLYGFVALAADGNTIQGITFYEHGETPGLGGEVDNPRWKALWKGKKAYNDEGEPAITVVKESDKREGREQHEIDALSGATITSNGVRDFMQYWLSDHGFGKFLDRVRKKGEQ